MTEHKQSAGHAPASETPRPAETCECGRALPTMCGGCIVEDYEAAFGHVVSPASETGEASAWQPTVLFINERLDHWRKELDPLGVVTPRGVRAVTVIQELEVVRSTLPPLPLAPSEDETTTK